VIRSTIELGNFVVVAIHSDRPGCNPVGVAGERGAGDIAVALDVVAGHDRRRRSTGFAAALQSRGDQSENGVIAGVIDGTVAALGDSHGHDACGRGTEQLDHRFWVVGCVAVVDDRTDDPDVTCAVRVFQDQGVEAVLGLQRSFIPWSAGMTPTPKCTMPMPILSRS
jgi:hypothetical protein